MRTQKTACCGFGIGNIRVIPSQIIQNLWSLTILHPRFFSSFTVDRYYQNEIILKVSVTNSLPFRSLLSDIYRVWLKLLFKSKIRFKFMSSLITCDMIKFFSWKFKQRHFLGWEIQKSTNINFADVKISAMNIGAMWL